MSFGKVHRGRQSFLPGFYVDHMKKIHDWDSENTQDDLCEEKVTRTIHKNKILRRQRSRSLDSPQSKNKFPDITKEHAVHPTRSNTPGKSNKGKISTPDAFTRLYQEGTGHLRPESGGVYVPTNQHSVSRLKSPTKVAHVKIDADTCTMASHEVKDKGHTLDRKSPGAMSPNDHASLHTSSLSPLQRSSTATAGAVTLPQAVKSQGSQSKGGENSSLFREGRSTAADKGPAGTRRRGDHGRPRQFLRQRSRSEGSLPGREFTDVYTSCDQCHEDSTRASGIKPLPNDCTPLSTTDCNDMSPALDSESLPDADSVSYPDADSESLPLVPSDSEHSTGRVSPAPSSRALTGKLATRLRASCSSMGTDATAAALAAAVRATADAKGRRVGSRSLTHNDASRSHITNQENRSTAKRHTIHSPGVQHGGFSDLNKALSKVTPTSRKKSTLKSAAACAAINEAEESTKSQNARAAWKRAMVKVALIIKFMDVYHSNGHCVIACNTPALVFEGPKLFWRLRCSTVVYVYEHAGCDCMEVVVEDVDHKVPFQRMYFHPSDILTAKRQHLDRMLKVILQFRPDLVKRSERSCVGEFVVQQMTAVRKGNGEGLIEMELKQYNGALNCE